MCPGPPVRNTSRYSAATTAVSAVTAGRDSVQPSNPARASNPAARVPPVSVIAAVVGPAPRRRNRAAAVAA